MSGGAMGMKRWQFLLLVAALCVPGCGSSPTQPPPPTGGSGDDAEPNDFTAQPLGALSSTDFVVNGSTSSGSDVDLFSVTASATSNLYAMLDWSSASFLELSLSNQSGVFVRHVSGGQPESCTLSGLPPGTYTIRVGSLTDVSTSYTLTIGQR